MWKEHEGAWEGWEEREERKGCSFIFISKIYLKYRSKKYNDCRAYKGNLTNVLYRLISPSSPLRRCSNFTIGTLAVVIGRMFLKPEGEGTKKFNQVKYFL